MPSSVEQCRVEHSQVATQSALLSQIKALIKINSVYSAIFQPIGRDIDFVGFVSSVGQTQTCAVNGCYYSLMTIITQIMPKSVVIADIIPEFAE